jgi:arylsulfatase A-like enzyme
MTMISTKLAGAGYKCHFVGKWHVGMAKRETTPVGRNFSTSLGYFHSTNDYFNERRAQGCGGRTNGYVDLWDTDRPAGTLNGTGPEGGWEEGLFAQRAVHTIAAHDPRDPLFLYYAMHSSCVSPADATHSEDFLQAPPSW